MTSDRIIAQLKATAAENGGRPLGARAFHAATNISRNDLWKAGFAKYSDAVRAAGLEPNALTAARDGNEMLRALAEVTRRCARFPVIGDLKVARANDPNFPSYEAFLRLAGGTWADLPKLLLAYCQQDPDYSDVVALVGDSTPSRPSSSSSSARVAGYVYLAKHGRDYKIGRSNDVTRRRREISLLLPAELEHVHAIETDDPEGIEQYWHRRFADRRGRGEWFRLTPEDVAAFKRRRYQ